MFDINFFQRAENLKRNILDGHLKIQDVIGIERELEHLRSVDPTLFNIETTNYCNMTCVMCPRTTLMTRENQWIDPKLFEKVLDQIVQHEPKDLETFWDFIESKYGIGFDNPSENSFYFYVVSRCVILHGFGEPLVDKNIVDRVQACTNRNIPTYFSCVPANINLKKIKSVMENGLGVIKFSIDALDDEGARRIRGKHNNYEKAYEKILQVIEMKEKEGFKTKIVPCMIDLSNDEEKIEDQRNFMEMWKDLPVFAYVKSQDNRWYYEEDETIENRSHHEQQYCEFPWISMTIMSNGNVVPCTQDYDTEMTFGNIKEQSIEEIWNGPKYQDFRMSHINGINKKDYKCFDRCDQTLISQRIKPAMPLKPNQPLIL